MQEKSVHFVKSVVNDAEKVPENYNEAVNGVKKKERLEAINEEMKSLERNNTWELVERPENISVIDCNWVFQIKYDEKGNIQKYKVRLIARGFLQRKGINYSETYSPVANMTTIRVLIAVANHFKWVVYQMDVKTAFLNGYLYEEVYMSQPEGFVKDERLVCKLNRSLYGLKQASKCWNDCFNQFIVSLGFVRSKSDYCLYFKISGSLRIFVILYLDDILLTGNNVECLDKLKLELTNTFEMDDLGNLKYFLNLEIRRDVQNQTVAFSQKQFILRILKRFNMENCKGIATPMEYNLKL